MWRLGRVSAPASRWLRRRCMALGRAGRAGRPVAVPAAGRRARGAVRPGAASARPADERGPRIDVHFAVLPALARNKLPDPVFFLAGGPGQSAIDTGRAAEPHAGALRQPARHRAGRPARHRPQRAAGLRRGRRPAAAARTGRPGSARCSARMRCLRKLQALPHGDLRHYTTTHGDGRPGRRAAGAGRRAHQPDRRVLRHARGAGVHAPVSAAVRRAVLDGVAPPDMALPEASATDSAGGVRRAAARLRERRRLRRAPPAPARNWQALAGLAAAQGERAAHPLTGRDEDLTLTRDMLLGMVRAPLYAPALAAALPAALDEAAQGRLRAAGRSVGAIGPARGARCAGAGHALLGGLHRRRAAPAPKASPTRRTSARGLAPLYRQVCADWPRGDGAGGLHTICRRRRRRRCCCPAASTR